MLFERGLHATLPGDLVAGDASQRAKRNVGEDVFIGLPRCSTPNCKGLAIRDCGEAVEKSRC